MEKVTIWMHVWNTDGYVGTIGFGVTPEEDVTNLCGWTETNMGAETGVVVVQPKLLANGQYAEVREYPVHTTTFRKQDIVDTTIYSTMDQLVLMHQEAGDYDITDEAIEFHGIDSDLCGVNAIFSNEGMVRWIMVHDCDCFVTMKPLRGIQQKCNHVYDGDLSGFQDEIVPQVFQALNEKIQAQGIDFSLDQFKLTKLEYVSSRRRILDDGENEILMDYIILPPADSEETDETEDDFTDSLDYLTDIVSVTEAAFEEGFEIEGASFVEGSLASEKTATFIEDEDETFMPVKEEEDEEVDCTFQVMKTLPLLLMTILCISVGLLGQ